VGVARVELKVNGTTVAIDSAAPYSFTWNSTGVPNGMATLLAVAYDVAGNSAASASVAVNVANAAPPVLADTTPPLVAIANPVAGAVSGMVTVVMNASDNLGAAGILQQLYIDGALKAQGTGATLSYSWDTRWITLGTHTLTAAARDKAGNTAMTSVRVSK
jgi:thermitase